ncbi:putative late blight resistance protein-like protein R1B-13 [Forsythia ovata]|uniref:Late blight resistance protein-like protein R1B-13 n=1 Tax=Forsythia ovata TaxID=205694 RepID=A0ABD1TRV7_9LAMI
MGRYDSCWVLQNLEVLKLRDYAFIGSEWEPTEGEFCQLKVLLLEETELVHWKADNIHFPRLQKLMDFHCWKLEEIPSGIGEIPTLEMIEMDNSSHSAANSAEQLLEEQQCLGNESLINFASMIHKA